MIDYFTSEKVTDILTAIRSKSGEIMYLIEGDTQAVLIDTCVGVKGLRNFVEKLTDKPITVLITHGHCDHAMGADEFDEVYMNYQDMDLYHAHHSLAVRKGYIEASCHEDTSWLEDDSNLDTEEVKEFLPLEDGMVFELGNETIEVYALGGHTHGTMVLLLVKERILITGDACNASIFLFDENSLSVEEYRENLIHVRDLLKGRYDHCFMMHVSMDAGKELLDTVIDVCDAILQGKTDDMPFEFMGSTACIAMAVNKMFQRDDGKIGNIVYNRDHIYKA